MKPIVHEHKHVKQTGGRGQYAHMVIRLEPGKPGSGLEFSSEVVGGRIPREYVSAIERGIIDAMAEGPYAGYPVTDIKVAVLDGSTHDVDSSDMAFRTCGAAGFRDACRKSGLRLLEPIARIEATLPEDATGPVTGSLCGKRGKILEMETKGKTSVLRAEVPIAEMFGYSSELRSLTSGRGDFSMQFAEYAPVPASVAEKVLAARAEKTKKA
jgi:elongation factor G